MEQLISLLKKWQANSFVMSNAAHGFHWNVEGPLFTQYHDFFGKIYEDVDGTIDIISEWLRKFDTQAPYTLGQLMVNQTMVETLTTSNSPITMTKVLFDANEIMLNDLTVLLGAAKQAGEEGLANFISERQDSHKKWQWWLKASLTQTIN
jgi:starvation-inducible DNA-binding protein